MSAARVLGAAVMTAAQLAGCTPETPVAETARYLESEPDAGTRVTRILATASHLRMDDGRDDGDFVLFDRRTRVVHSVPHGLRNVTAVAEAKTAVAPPARFEARVEEQALPDAPRVGGRQPVLHRLFVNGALCAEVASAALLPELVRALREYQSVLATQQAALYRDVPESIAGDCDLANYVLRPEETLRHGLPLQRRFADGRAWELRDYAAAAEISGELFVVPPDYAVFRIGPASQGVASDR